MSKALIDRVREDAGSFEIVDPDDSSGITGFLKISEDNLYVFKDKSVYEILLADQIDPDRTNIKIPNSYRKVLGCGAASESFWRILMMVDALCQDSVLKAHVDRTYMMRETLALQERLCSIEQEIYAVRTEVERESGQADSDFARQNKALHLPQLDNATKRTHHILVEMRKCFQHCFDMFSHCFGLNRSVKFSEARSLVRGWFGDGDHFGEFLAAASQLFEFFRTARNSIEHPKANEFVQVSDFELMPNGTVRRPIVLFKYKEVERGPTD